MSSTQALSHTNYNLWNTAHPALDASKQVVSSAALQLSEIKGDPDGLQYYADLFLEVFKETLPIPFTRTLENISVSEDVTRPFQDTNHFVSGAWRTASHYLNFQMLTFVTVEVCGTVAAAAKIGLFSLASTADKLGGAASTLGNSFLVATGLPFIVGLAGVGFVFYGLDAGVKNSFAVKENIITGGKSRITEAEAERQAGVVSNYYKILMARCATKAGACGLFVYSSVAKVTLVSAGTIAFSTSALVVATLGLAILGFHYKRSYDHDAVIKNFENALLKNSDFQKHLPPVSRKPGEDNLFSKAFKVSDTIASNNEPMQKVAKGIPSVIYCSKLLAGFVANTIFDNRVFHYLAHNQGVTTLAVESDHFSTTINGLKIFDRAKELTAEDEQGIPLRHKWTQDKLNNRSYLTVSHFMDFLKLLKTTKLVELSILSTKVVFAGLSFSVIMLKDLAVIAASYYGYKNADTEITVNAGKANVAGSKTAKSLANYDLSYQISAHSRAIAAADAEKPVKHRLGKDVAVSKATQWKHQFLMNQTGTAAYNRVDIEGKKSAALAKIDEINNSWSRYFRSTEVRVLRQEIGQYDAIAKVYAWYAAPSLTMYSGAKITLPLTSNSIRGEARDTIELPAGTKIVLLNGREVTLRAPIKLELKEDIIFSSDTSVILNMDTIAKPVNGGTLEDTFNFKNLAKAFRWDKTQAALTNVEELLKEKRVTAQRYEPCKATICAISLLLAATSATVLVPIINVMGVVVTSMDIYKYVRDKQIEEKKNTLAMYKAAPTNPYQVQVA